jgi:hypothetical protein
MRVFRRKPKSSQLSRTEALAYKPIKSRKVTEVRLNSGEVLIEYPLAVRPWVSAVARRLGRPQNPVRSGKLQLDMMGTSVWDLVDGERSVGRIVELFASNHRLNNREAEISVTQFIRELGRRGLIGLG